MIRGLKLRNSTYGKGMLSIRIVLWFLWAWVIATFIIKMIGADAGDLTKEFLQLKVIELSVIPICLFLEFMFTTFNGYILQEEKITFNNKYAKNDIFYNDIKCVLIVNFSDVHGRVTTTPWVSIIAGETDEILQYCTEWKEKKKGVLASGVIKFKLGSKIGHYYIGTIGELFRSDRKIKNYGFAWEKDILYLLKKYQGDYYIAKSVYHNREEKYDKIFDEYGISKERIHFIDDLNDDEMVK